MNLTLIITSFLGTVLPIAFYLYFLWKLDKYEREPKRIVLYNFFWGAIGAVILSFILSIILFLLFSLFFGTSSALINLESLLIAPVTEEFSKGIFILFLINNIEFDNLTDGLVYGGSIGLGFGLTENFLYLINTSGLEEWIFTFSIRIVFTTLMHAIATASLGGFIGFYKYSENSKKILFGFAGYLTAVLIHFSWNNWAGSIETFGYSLILMTTYFLIFMIVFYSSIKREKSIIQDALEKETLNGNLPLKLKEIVLSKGLLDKKKSIVLKNNLAKYSFLKQILKNSEVKSSELITERIEQYRKRLIIFTDEIASKYE